MSNDEGKWYFCLNDNTVEQSAGCKAADRLGPYDTREQAEAALATLHARNERYDREDDWDQD